MEQYLQLGKRREIFSVESSTSDAFDCAELWFKQLTDSSEYRVTDPFAANSGGRALTPEGAANKPNLNKYSPM